MSTNDESRPAIPGPDSNLTAAHNPEVDPNVTRIRPQDQSASSRGDAYDVAVPGFTIESTLGHGGMGVVYKATQTGLNRVVALKMLIAGQYATPALRARFLLEAESVAALEHPHIIRVFAFGESGGHPYLAMEYVSGGTLATRIKKGGPLAAREATELLAKLAEAVAHAHSRGVVHRDIKPLNVLLTADGEPRLSDFGLAKVGRADQNLSVTGQVLGTPAYMAPEQAAGKIREVGTAADVYSLGALFYDVLTGRPPFQGDSAAVTLQKVMTEEPERPRKLNATIPRDLETICLKCLEKEPAKRYPTAQALADDLRRYLRDEPIMVRPAGALERGYKWVKRNKVVATAMAAVSLALLVGTGVSLGFGLEADKQAKEAKKQKKDADDATAREEKEKLTAIVARNDAITARNDVQQKSTELKRTLAKALLNPFRADKRDAPLTPYERGSLWQVVELRRDDVALMFLEESTRTPLTCKQLANRSEYILHAAIGLDMSRRDAMDHLLLANLRRNPQSTQPQSLALATSYWGHPSPALASQAADILLAALIEDKRFDARRRLAESLSAVAARMEPAKADVVCAQAADILVDALTKESSPYFQWHLTEGLSAVVARMEPAKAADILVTALHKGENSKSYFASILSTVAARMAPEKAADILLAALTKETDYSARRSLAEGLSAVAARMEPAKADVVCAQTAEILVKAMIRETEPFRRRYLAEGLSSVAARMEPEKADVVCAQAADILVETLAKTNEKVHIVLGLSAVVARMEPEKAAEILVKAMIKETDSSARSSLADGLSAVAARMEPAMAKVVCAQAADILVADLTKVEANAARTVLRQSLLKLAARMEPTKAADTLVRTLIKEPTFHELKDLAEGLSAAVAKMEPAKAEQICAYVAGVLLADLAEERKSTIAPLVRRHLAEALSAVAARMEPAKAEQTCTRAADILLTALTKNPPFYGHKDLAEGLSAVAARMEPAKAKVVCAQALNILVEALAKETNSSTRMTLAEGLSAVAARMEPAKATDVLLVVLTREADPWVRIELAVGLSALAVRMEPTKAELICAQAADILLAALSEAPSYRKLTQSLLTLAARIDPAKAANLLMVTLSQVVYPTGLVPLQEWAARGEIRKSLTQGLWAVVGGISPAEHNLARDSPLLAIGSFATPHNVLASLPLLHPHFHPQPRPLPPQTLVDLLKHPFCFGEARRVVLDALEFTYHRKFADQWDFVEYAQKHQPQLDLLTPPKRLKQP